MINKFINNNVRPSTELVSYFSWVAYVRRFLGDANPREACPFNLFSLTVEIESMLDTEGFYQKENMLN